VLAFAAITSGSYGRTFAQTGTFAGIGVEDWRSSVRTARAELERRGLKLVLYRSGFVEESLPQPGAAHPATRSPLAGPGEPPLAANVISLIHRWSDHRRAQYFENVVRPAILGGSGLIVVAQRAEDIDGNFTTNLLGWLQSAMGPVRVEWPRQHRGIDVVVVTPMAEEACP
jgi:hypothetical protein